MTMPGTTTNGAGEAIIEVRDLVKHFPITRGVIFQRPGRQLDEVAFGLGFGGGLVGTHAIDLSCRRCRGCVAKNLAAAGGDGVELAELS